jgi:hypothetical protein
VDQIAVARCGAAAVWSTKQLIGPRSVQLLSEARTGPTLSLVNSDNVITPCDNGIIDNVITLSPVPGAPKNIFYKKNMQIAIENFNF